MSGVLRSRVSVFALLVWVAAAIGPVVFPHDGGFDFACADDAWASPHPTTQFESVRPPVADDHCLVCHLERIGRGAVSERVAFHTNLEVALAGMVSIGQGVSADAALRIPARAPPSFLL